MSCGKSSGPTFGRNYKLDMQIEALSEIQCFTLCERQQFFFPQTDRRTQHCETAYVVSRNHLASRP